MSDNEKVTVSCSTTDCIASEPKHVDPWTSALCGVCGEWMRSPSEVAEFVEHRPEYWDQYMGFGVPMPGISP